MMDGLKMDGWIRKRGVDSIHPSTQPLQTVLNKMNATLDNSIALLYLNKQ
jgi:hypothetical protein